MNAIIKVLKNSQEIEDAKQANQLVQTKRNQELQKPKKDRVEILDVTIPEKVLEEKPYLFNVFDVEWATISQNDMIFITTEKGRSFEVVYDEAIWKEINAVLTLKEKAHTTKLKSTT